MDTGQLLVLYHAFGLAQEALNGVYNRPRSKEAVCAVIENEIERYAQMLQMIVREAETRRPADDEERQDRGEIMILWGLACGSWRDIGTAFVSTTAGPREVAA